MLFIMEANEASSSLPYERLMQRDLGNTITDHGVDIQRYFFRHFHTLTGLHLRVHVQVVLVILGHKVRLDHLEQEQRSEEQREHG